MPSLLTSSWLHAVQWLPEPASGLSRPVAGHGVGKSIISLQVVRLVRDATPDWIEEGLA